MRKLNLCFIVCLVAFMTSCGKRSDPITQGNASNTNGSGTNATGGGTTGGTTTIKPKVVGMTDISASFKKNADGSFSITSLFASNLYQQTVDFKEGEGYKFAYVANNASASMSTYLALGNNVQIKASNPLLKDPKDVVDLDTTAQAGAGYFVAFNKDTRVAIILCKTAQKYSSEISALTGLPDGTSSDKIISSFGTKEKPIVLSGTFKNIY